MEYIFSCKYEICFIRIVTGIDIIWEAICLQFCAYFYNKKRERICQYIGIYLLRYHIKVFCFSHYREKLKHQLITTLNSTSVWMVSSA